MKKYSNIILIIIIILGLNRFCSANPLSNIMSFFQKDLVIDVLYMNHRNLVQGSDVYLAGDIDGQKTLIGKVKNVSLTESQMFKVEIIIDKKYKKKLYQTTSFVLMSGLFSENSKSYIVAISSSEASDTQLLKSGALVKGVTFLEYKIATAGEGFKKVIDNIKKQNNEIMTQLEAYIDTVNTEAFHKKIKELADRISQFSIEQKNTFKKEVLPALRDMFDSVIKQLEEQNNTEKSKDLKRQLMEIENLIEA